MSSPNNKDFAALKKEWYNKLKETGFEDIEQDDNYLKSWTSSLVKARNKGSYSESKAEYYRIASHFLHDHAFVSKKEQFIWERHSEGISIRNIAIALKQAGIPTYRRDVHDTIQRLRKEMLKYVP